jgi:RNA polymerase sigma-70 factor (ECF subfamily)
VNGGLEHENWQSPGWEAWLAEHTPGLLLYARQQTRSQADAEDLVQEAVVEAWRRQADGTTPPLSWVYGTVRRRAVDLARSNQRRARREAVAADGAEPAWFDSAPEDREQTRLIEKAMRALPEYHREVLTLKIWGGLTFAEIGGVLGIPPNTAASRYRYALVELRKLTVEILA